jgi:IclR family acetate operon transcriptional repressor
VKNQTQRRKPAYLIESVDNVLKLIQMLRDEGSFGVTEAAHELGVAPSTAHRLLAMLVYRGFALQDDSRRYQPGPSLGAPPARLDFTRRLRDIAGPHLELLCSRLDETVNLMVRVGTQVRFLDTVEASTILRIGDRQGAVLPARHASGGKALLAALDERTLERLYRDPRGAFSGDYLEEAEFNKLLRQLQRVRRAGYALNREETEEGVTALGMPVRGPFGHHIAAISVAVPSGRFESLMGQGLVDLTAETRSELEADVAAQLLDEPQPS